MKQLNSSERSAFRAPAHPLKPVVIIGGGGLTPGVLAEIERSLKTHELIKIRVGGADYSERESMRETICTTTGSMPIQHIGKILIIYRAHPKEEPKPLPRKPPVKSAKPLARPLPRSAGRPSTKKPAGGKSADWHRTRTSRS